MYGQSMDYYLLNFPYWIKETWKKMFTNLKKSTFKPSLTSIMTASMKIIQIMYSELSRDLSGKVKISQKKPPNY